MSKRCKNYLGVRIPPGREALHTIEHGNASLDETKEKLEEWKNRVAAIILEALKSNRGFTIHTIYGCHTCQEEAELFEFVVTPKQEIPSDAMEHIAQEVARNVIGNILLQVLRYVVFDPEEIEQGFNFLLGSIDRYGPVKGRLN